MMRTLGIEPSSASVCDSHSAAGSPSMAPPSDNSRPPSVGFLAFTAGLDADRFQERLRELADLGFVTWMGNREGLKYSLEGLQQAIL